VTGPILSTYSIQQWVLSYVPHLLRHGTSVFKVTSERPVILNVKCSSEGAVTTYLNVLGLTRPARSGLELTIGITRQGLYHWTAGVSGRCDR
jgi:hypothetical protein